MSRRITRSLSLEPNNNDICPICMGSMDFYNLNQRGQAEQENVTQLACSHKFHDDCIREWKENNNTCPVCRKNMYIGVSSLNNNDTPEDIYNAISNVLNMYRNGNENVFESGVLPPNRLYQQLIPFGLRERDENNGNEVMLLLRSVISRNTAFRKIIIRDYNRDIYNYRGNYIDATIYLFASNIVRALDTYLVVNQIIRKIYEDQGRDIGIGYYDYGNHLFDLVREYYLFIGVDNLQNVYRDHFTDIFTADGGYHIMWFTEAMYFINTNPNEIINMEQINYTHMDRYPLVNTLWKYFMLWLHADNNDRKNRLKSIFLNIYGIHPGDDGSWENELAGGKKKRKVKRKTKRKINKRRKTRRKI